MNALLCIAFAFASDGPAEVPRPREAFDAVNAELGGERYQYFTTAPEGVSALVETAYRKTRPRANGIACGRQHDLFWGLPDANDLHQAYIFYVCRSENVWSRVGLARSSNVYVLLTYRYDHAGLEPLRLDLSVDAAPTEDPDFVVSVDLVADK